jgi:hypothetical protein
MSDGDDDEDDLLILVVTGGCRCPEPVVSSTAQTDFVTKQRLHRFLQDSSTKVMFMDPGSGVTLRSPRRCAESRIINPLK